MSNKTTGIIQVNWVKLTRNAIALLGFILVMYGLAHVTELKFNKLQIVQQYNQDRAPVSTASERLQQLDCLAQNIYYEAGHEPFEGKAAVGQVTLNRVKDGRFGKGVCGVVNQKNVFTSRVICQFSWVCESKSRVKPRHAADYAESERVAKLVLLEGFRLPSLHDALFYHADYISPGWGKGKVAKIGRHIFYKGY